MYLKFKEYIILEYKSGNTLLKKGTTLFEIEDPEKKIFLLLEKRKWRESYLPKELVVFLQENHLVIMDYKIPENNIFSKNLFYFEDKIENFSSNPVFFQKELNNKSILIIGCGGVGTVVLQNLLFFGITNFILIDFDEINLHNLNRQLFFTKNDVGKIKVDVLKKKIEENFPHINIKVYNSIIRENNNLLSNILKEDKIDFLVNAADSPENINMIILNECSKHKVPFINGSVGIDSATWGPIYLEPEKIKLDNITKFSKKLEGSISSTNMILGSFVSNDILEYFLNPKKEILYKKKIINFKTYNIEVV